MIVYSKLDLETNKGMMRAKASLIYKGVIPARSLGECHHIAQPRFAFLVAIRLAHETVVKDRPSINTARHRPRSTADVIT